MELQKNWGKIYAQSFEIEPLILYRYVPSSKFYARSFVAGNNPIYIVFKGAIFAKAQKSRTINFKKFEHSTNKFYSVGNVCMYVTNYD